MVLFWNPLATASHGRLYVVLALATPRYGCTIELENEASVTTLTASMESASKAEILGKIQLMMKELFGLEADRVQPETRLIEDLELDSLDAIDLAVKVEETTGLAFDETQIRQLRTIEDVIVAIEAIVSAQKGFRSPAPARADS